MNYKDFTKIAYQINNYSIRPFIDKIGKEFDYDRYYKGQITPRFYDNPIGFICNHDCGERLFELLWEAAQKNYEDLYESN